MRLGNQKEVMPLKARLAIAILSEKSLLDFFKQILNPDTQNECQKKEKNETCLQTQLWDCLKNISYISENVYQLQSEFEQMLCEAKQSEISLIAGLIRVCFKELKDLLFTRSNNGTIVANLDSLLFVPGIIEKVLFTQLLAFSLSEQECPQNGSLCRLVKNCYPIKVDHALISSLLENKVPDLHRHFKGTIIPEIILLDCLEKTKHIKDRKLRREFLFISAIRKEICNNQREKNKDAKASSNKIEQLLKSMLQKNSNTEPARSGLSRSSNPRVLIENELCFLCEVLRYILQKNTREPNKNNPVLVNASIFYMLFKNQHLQKFIQPENGANGLEKFDTFFRNEIRKAGENEIKDSLFRIRQAFDLGNCSLVEMRVSPDESLQLLNKLTKDLKNEPDIIDKIGIIMHFVRKNHDNSSTGIIATHIVQSPAFVCTREKIKEEAHRIKDIFSRRQFNQLLVGIDVAGIETKVPIEVFAPRIRWLREKLDHGRALFVTCHAGEDFHDIVSGLRAIDESLKFLEMRSGDRIGHGLSLGEDPIKWAESVGNKILLSKGEHFDNLVWLLHWGQEAYTSPKQIQSWLFEAIKLSDELYDIEFCANSAYDAWIFRKNPPEECPRGAESQKNKAVLMWHKYLYDRVCRMSRAEMMRVSFSDDAMLAITNIQKSLLQKVIDTGIAIEVNPSSNLRIGNMTSLCEHPIFNWTPIDRNARIKNGAMVVIGSDDPGVFGTEINMEYALLAAAAKKNGASAREIIEWLDDLRDMGHRYSFIRKV